MDKLESDMRVMNPPGRVNGLYVEADNIYRRLRPRRTNLSRNYSIMLAAYLLVKYHTKTHELMGHEKRLETRASY